MLRQWSCKAHLGVRRLTLDNHVSAVARSCNYHARAIRHVRHLLTVDLAQTLACSLILSRIDYCNAVLHCAPSGTIQKLQRVQNNAARVVLQAPRRSHANSLLQELHWLKLNSTTRTRPDPHGPNGVSPQKSPCGSGQVRVRVRVVEFSSSPTMCADFVRVGSV